MLDNTLFIEAIKYEYLKSKKVLEIQNIKIEDNVIYLTLSHLITKDTIQLSFNNKKLLHNYLIYEIYGLKIADILELSVQDKELLSKYTYLNGKNQNTYKEYILCQIYNMYKNDKITDDYFINQCNISNTTIKTYPTDYNTSISILDISMRKLDDIYIIDVLIEMVYRGKLAQFKINALNMFNDENGLDVLEWYLNLDISSFKLQVLNKLDNVELLKVEYKNATYMTLFDIKQKILIEFLKLYNVDFYIGSNNKIITPNSVKYLLVEYLKRCSSGILKLNLFREWLILAYGLHGLSFNNFLAITNKLK